MFFLRRPRSRMKDLDPLGIWLLRVRAPFQPRHDNTTAERRIDRCTAADKTSENKSTIIMQKTTFVTLRGANIIVQLSRETRTRISYQAN